METKSLSATMIWSAREMSSGVRVESTMRVVSRSAWEGRATPLVWLCASTTEVAWLEMAISATLRREKEAELMPPRCKRRQAQEINQFLRGAEKVGQQVFPTGLGGGEHHARAHPGEEIPPRQGRDEVEQYRGALADAAHGLELLEGRLQHGGDAAEVLEKLACQVVGVPPGQGIEEQQLQHLVILEDVHPLL